MREQIHEAERGRARKLQQQEAPRLRDDSLFDFGPDFYIKAKNLKQQSACWQSENGALMSWVKEKKRKKSN